MHSNNTLSIHTYKSGQLISEHDLSDLVADCTDGSSLILRNIHFAPFFSNTSHTFSEQSRLAWIGSKYPVPEVAHEIHITYPFSLPCFRTANDSPRNKHGTITHEFCARRFSFEGGVAKIDLRKNSIVIRLKTDEPSNINDLIQRTMLAISFCAGCEARFTSVVVKEDGRESYNIISAVENKIKTNQLLGPCSVLSFDPSEAIYMIKSALTNSIENKKSVVELFSHALSINKSRKSYPEDYASACSRALEFACNTIAEKDEKLAAKLGAECKSVKIATKTLELPLLKSRLNGFLDSLTPFSPSNFLKQLELQGQISKGTTKAFNDIRHKVAHGTIFTESESNDVYWSVEKIKDAFHELTLRKINYKGKMVQYSVPDWPSKTIS